MACVNFSGVFHLHDFLFAIWLPVWVDTWSVLDLRSLHVNEVSEMFGYIDRKLMGNI
jgi:hypothetical protein